ncbi:MAG TPA: amino acid adenylation domain-containing protein, partial [Hyphomicrobiaceae bacterium]|nr:amino acid adenylation domain-containing protein [Hyphomicrobiaceae bacterium]
MTAIFADVVARHGSRPALRSGRRTVSYRDLDRKSDAAARLLERLGVGAGDRVALVLPRSIEAIVSIIAILKCGAVYVPLDPGNPGGATAALLADCSPRLVIATGTLLRTLPLGEIGRLDITELASVPDDEPPRPSLAVSGDDAAYVMYTSGSTGKPKGVVVPHRGIVRLTVDTDYMTIGPDDVVLHTGLLAFDASTWEIWSALLNGASLAIVVDAVPSTTVLAETVRDAGVTALLLTTGLFHAVSETDASAYAGVRLFLTGGDVLSPQHAVRMARALPGCRIVNAYGPTENSVITCTFDVPVGHDNEAPVPIGRPIRGTTAIILDDALQPVDDGDVGQLATGGAGVALGYLNSDALTAERFVPDPTGGTGRLYLTGDLARRKPDGSIEFLGRTDRQVKIAGKRIELDEIEHRLRADGRIADAAVTVRRAGETAVISAYLKPATWPVADDFAQKVIDDYRATVPAALVPAEVAVLECLPLNANGKLDRKALPAIAARGRASTGAVSGSSPPTTVGTLVEIWSTVLGRDTVPTDANFFDLGGTSLTMVRVHAAIVTRLGRNLAMTELFAHPTIGKLARFIDGAAKPRRAEVSGPRPASSGEIAIVGMAARFPGADTVEAFWDNLVAGRETIRRFETHELEDAFDEATRARADFVAAKPILDDVDLFDAAFFGFNARDAALTDPQQRVFLECVWQAFEDAGYDPKSVAGKIGIYAGSAYNTYFLNNVLSSKSSARSFTSDFQVGSYQELIGALPEFVATRTAYKLDLRGPAVNVQSACSTSLLAVAQAVQALRAGQCDMCVAGAVSISFPQKRGYIHTEGGMVSRDGSCRPFDATASGTVFGSGAGVVVLKRLEDAMRDGDHVYAVVSGIGVNNDGADKIGFTAPSAAGQTDAIAAALSDAGVDADAIGLIEAHGTATPLGDPIEFSGLMDVFGAERSEDDRCFLGSVKANVGHLDAAAGVAGLIKAALVLDRGLVPPQINFGAPNAAIDLERSPFRIATRPAPW